MALNLIEKGVHRVHPYALIIDQIRSFMDLPWHLVFQHTLREGNACADWLAKYGANMDQHFVTWNSYPAQLSSMLLADAMGVLHTRL